MSPPTSTRVDRYPLLAPVYHSVYPNPKPVTGYDATQTAPTAPPAGQLEASKVSALKAKMENAVSGGIYENYLLNQLKRFVWLQGKTTDEGWKKIRGELGAAGTDFDKLSKKDERIDQLRYKGAPSTYMKFGFEVEAE